MRPRVYVAGPWGFTEPGRKFYAARVLPAIRKAGLQPLDPWAAGKKILGPVLANPKSSPAKVKAACLALGAANEAMIRRADAVFALVDGCDLDSGTCSEIGFAASIGVPIVAMRTDYRSAGDAPEIPINLQVLYFIESSGGSVLKSLVPAIRELKRVVAARA